jgi:hypothetical protein
MELRNDENPLAELMVMLQQLATAWIDSYTLGSPLTAGARQRAKDAVTDLVAEDPIRGVQLVGIILSRTEDPWILENTGAGPIEDLLKTASREMLALLSMHPAIRAVAIAISNIWTGSLSEPVRAELQRILHDVQEQL